MTTASTTFLNQKVGHYLPFYPHSSPNSGIFVWKTSVIVKPWEGKCEQYRDYTFKCMTTFVMAVIQILPKGLQITWNRPSCTNAGLSQWHLICLCYCFMERCLLGLPSGQPRSFLQYSMFLIVRSHDWIPDSSLIAWNLSMSSRRRYTVFRTLPTSKR